VEGVAERLAEVRERVAAAAGGRPVTLVAVSKGAGPGAVTAARDAGVADFGENYAHELVAKHGVVGPGPRWHFLGSVQRRKVRALAPLVDLWQSVDRPAAGREIARRTPGAAVLVQVNVTGSPGRNGCTWEEAPALVDALRAEGLDVRGLMCVGPRHDPGPAFRRLARLAGGLGLAELSMGMSDDLEVAVQEGSTMVRVGTALFGPRSDSLDLRR
jgi:pyridoxal phosphate enzyme (YggS family)